MSEARIRRATEHDLVPINRVFSEAFTEAYRRDGLSIRIPPLHTDFLRLEWMVSGGGAMVLEERGRVIGFNFARAHGSEGWFGPLAVTRKAQGVGHGKALVRRAVQYLKRKKCTTIGMETMPRTYNNLGLYTRLGFLPGHLVFTSRVEIPVHIPKVKGHKNTVLLGEISEPQRMKLEEPLRRFWNDISPGIDYTEEILLTLEEDFGDVLVLKEGDRVIGFLTFHFSPYFISDGPGVLRVARLGAVREGDAFPILMFALAEYGIRNGMDELLLRCQSSDWKVTQTLLQWGFRIVHTDLRMALEGFSERPAEDHIHMSRWG